MRRFKRLSTQLAAKPTARGVLTKLAGKLHYHACCDCRLVYSCSCAAADVKARCSACRETRPHPRSAWDTARDPMPCCVNNVRQVTTADDLLRYQLAGPGPWFICKTCARCHSKPPTDWSSSDQPS